MIHWSANHGTITPQTENLWTWKYDEDEDEVHFTQLTSQLRLHVSGGRAHEQTPR